MENKLTMFWTLFEIHGKYLGKKQYLYEKRNYIEIMRDILKIQFISENR